MNMSNFKDPVSHMYIVDVVVTFWSLTQEVAGLKLLGHMINLYQKLD